MSLKDLVSSIPQPLLPSSALRLLLFLGMQRDEAQEQKGILEVP